VGAFPFRDSLLAGGEPPERTGQSWNPRVQEFFAIKEKLGRALARQFKIEAAPEMWQYFDAGIAGIGAGSARSSPAWPNNPASSAKAIGGSTVHNLVWPPLLEAQLAYECFSAMDLKFVKLFANETIRSIPPHAIYFGGTDPGRGVITACVQSHADADPFFILTQNGLADGLYLEYLRTLFGRQIVVPTEKDLQRIFAQYKADAGIRLDQGRLKQGEQVSRKDGEVEIKGQVSIMEVNGLLARFIFDRNPTREFYGRGKPRSGLDVPLSDAAWIDP